MANTYHIHSTSEMKKLKAHVSSPVLGLLALLLMHVLIMRGCFVLARQGIRKSELINPQDSEGLLQTKSSLEMESPFNSDRPIRSQETRKRLDDKKLLEEAAEDMVKLMHKDYKGFNMPRGKPPIHNHFPQH